MCFSVSDAMQGFGVFLPAGPVRSLPLTPERRAHVERAVAMRAERRAARARAIEGMCDRAVASGQERDPSHWAMVYDFEMAPRTNGRTMLLELGVIPIPPQDITTDDELHEALWTLVEGLAAQRVYLLNTDHLGDRQLYERLFYKILDEPTHCLPPEGASAEYIDVLHAMDISAGGHGAELDRLLAEGAHPRGALQSGMRAPPQGAPICDRDRYLPRAAL